MAAMTATGRCCRRRHRAWAPPTICTGSIDFLFDNSAVQRRVCEDEIDRYIAVPGQATAYMVGRVEIERLRTSPPEHSGLPSCCASSMTSSSAVGHPPCAHHQGYVTAPNPGSPQVFIRAKRSDPHSVQGNAERQTRLSIAAVVGDVSAAVYGGGR